MQDTALILNLGKFREYDAWVRLLTRQSGICTAFAFGASKSKRRFAGCLDTLNIVDVSIEKSRTKDFLQLQETHLQSTLPLRNDWRLLGIATNCLRFIEAIDIALETSEESYDFISEFLSLLAPYAQKGNANFIPPLFRFKLASIQGYAPNIHSCVRCDSLIQSKCVFSVQEGGILCNRCVQNSFSTAMHLFISAETLDFLRLVQKEKPALWLHEVIPHPIVNQYGKLIDAFIQYHIGLEWKKNRFVAV